MSDQTTWHSKVFFGLHFDLHAGEQDTELGKETTYEHIRAELAKVKPDWVQYDCKGHPGYTGYPTKVGTPSPGIVKDALSIWSNVAHDMGLPIVVHYSGVWDRVQWEKHPEWSRRKADGALVGGEGWNPHAMATDSPYDDEILIPPVEGSHRLVRHRRLLGGWRMLGRCPRLEPLDARSVYPGNRHY